MCNVTTSWNRGEGVGAAEGCGLHLGDEGGDVCYTVGQEFGPQLLKLLASFLYVSCLSLYHVQV